MPQVGPGKGDGAGYEDFGRDCEAAFRRLCRILEIGYHPDMVHWRLRFPDDSPVIWRPGNSRTLGLVRARGAGARR